MSSDRRGEHAPTRRPTAEACELPRTRPYDAAGRLTSFGVVAGQHLRRVYHRGGSGPYAGDAPRAGRCSVRTPADDRVVGRYCHCQSAVSKQRDGRRTGCRYPRTCSFPDRPSLDRMAPGRDRERHGRSTVARPPARAARRSTNRRTPEPRFIPGGRVLGVVSDVTGKGRDDVSLVTRTGIPGTDLPGVMAGGTHRESSPRQRGVTDP